MTRSQIDRLGARIRVGEISDTDLRMLDEYRRSFADAYGYVMRRLRNDFGLDPTGRAAKSTFAIMGKLRRESVRLSQIQDIAGCRVIVPDVPAQDEVVRSLTSGFESVSVIDRRERPSHGYRAVHLVVAVNGTAVEIQVRTTAQQLWAEISEKLADRFGIPVKYGEGPEDLSIMLRRLSNVVGQIGKLEIVASGLRQLVDTPSAPVGAKTLLEESTRGLEGVREELRQLSNDVVAQSFE